MTDSDLSVLRERAENGDETAVDELIELATELGDMDELRRLADKGNAHCGRSADRTHRRVTTSEKSGGYDPRPRSAHWCAACTWPWFGSRNHLSLHRCGRLAGNYLQSYPVGKRRLVYE